jgi:hypothetical protein
MKATASIYNSHPTPYPELNKVLQVLLKSIHSIVSDSFVGAYLQGSFAVGDFDRHSDVDFIIVLEEELSEVQLYSLQRVHANVYNINSRWAQHLEGSYFPREILRNHTRRGEKLWYLENGSHSLIRSDHCNTLIVRWVVREKGVTLAGPPPETLVCPISSEMLRGEIMGVITGWGQNILDDPAPYNNRFYQSFIVLSFCRMLHDLNAGVNGSKLAGTEWVKDNLDSSWSDLIDRAWDGRPNPAVSIRQPADPKDFEQTLKFVKYIIDKSKLMYCPSICGGDT